MPTTTAASLIVPEVIADLVETKLGDRITLLPLAVQDNTSRASRETPSNSPPSATSERLTKLPKMAKSAQPSSPPLQPL